MNHFDKELNDLVAKGKSQGYLTYDEVADYLPDEAVDPDKLDSLLDLARRAEHRAARPSRPKPEFFDEAGARNRRSRRAADDPTAADEDARDADDGEGCVLADPRDLGKWSNDPIRLYLSQMAEIPLLAREEEISLAKKIEVTRKRFRRTVLGCQLALRDDGRDARQGPRGVLPFDRTIKVSLTERLTKEQILARMPHNLADLGTPDAAQPAGFRAADQPASLAPRTERPPDKRFIRRRRKALMLVEELSLRTRRVQAMMRQMEEIAERMEVLRRQIAARAATRPASTAGANLRRELRDLMMLTQESPQEPPQPRRADEVAAPGLRAGQAPAFRRQPAAGRLDRQEVPQSGAELPGPDPGRQHRPDAGGRQVRVSPRLQVLDLRHLVDSPGHHPGHRRPGPDHPHPGPHDRRARAN